MPTMDREQLRQKIYSRIEELPTLPAVVPRLLDLMDRPGSNASDITEVISRDPAISSKVLKAANSAYYGFPQEISSLERAVALLGFNMVKSLALSIGIIHNLGSNGKSNGFSWEGLWVHSLAVATVMKELGKRTGPDLEQDPLFIIGLLHDIGKIVLNRFFTDLFEQVLKDTMDRERAPLYESERKIIGFDHGEVGAELLRRWKFPEIISRPIALHHQEGLPEGGGRTGVAMLHIADALPGQLGFGELDGLPRAVPDEDLDALGMSASDLEEVRAFLDASRQGIDAFFSAMVTSS
jgi:putative nucleotidyltransferase with HDIG domain